MFNVADWEIHFCKTFKKNAPETVLKKVVLTLSKLLPHFLVPTDLYTRTDADFSTKCYLENGKTDSIKSVF